MMDIVFIKQLEVSTTIGVFAWEREIKQKLMFDLELGTDIRAAAASDELADTLDYKAISHRICELVEASAEQLVERVAENVASMLLAEFAIGWLKLTVAKPGAVSMAESVGVIIQRGGKA